MDAIFLARAQFAFTVAFHFLFPALSIGLSWYVFYFMTKYFKSGNEEDAKVTKFWLKIFTITFAVGVGTGITMALQFGTNWATYTYLVGDIIGAPLAAEVILAFFLESTFLAVLIFGWSKVSRRTLWISSFLVAFGTTLSAFWILVVNSWMQTPAGYYASYDSNGNLIGVQLADFMAAVFNPSTVVRLLHTVTASIVVASFFIFGVSSYYKLRNKHEYLVKNSFRTVMIIILISSVALMFFGHLQASVVAENQPEKFATYELVFVTAPAQDQKFPMVAILNPFNGDILFRIDMPFFSLSDYMLMGSTSYRGLDSFIPDQLPPFVLTVYSFHFMILLGLLFIAFGFIGTVLFYKNRIYEDKIYNKLFLALGVIAIPFPFIAVQLGWMAAEVGRQPWIVYGLLKTSDAISVSVPEWQILMSLILFVSIYVILFILWVTLLVKTILKGPEEISVSEV